MLAVKVTLNPIFSPKVTHPFNRGDFDVLLYSVTAVSASEKSSIIANRNLGSRLRTFQRASLRKSVRYP